MERSFTLGRVVMLLRPTRVKWRCVYPAFREMSQTMVLTQAQRCYVAGSMEKRVHITVSHALTISEWDWRYRVGFDAELADQIAVVAAGLELREERAILGRTLDWACGFISLDRLLDALETSEISPVCLATLEVGKLLHVPESLRSFFEARLARTVARLGESLDRPLHDLLDRALTASYRPFLSRSLFEQVFGKRLDPLLRLAKVAVAVPHPGFQSITIVEAKAFVEAFIKDAATHPFLRGLLDASAVEVKYTNDSSGFAEFWPRELLHGTCCDQLIVHLNGQSLDLLTLQSTLCHEIYGHGSFYGRLRSVRPPLTDHGAMLLVEGWATGCEWRFSTPSYAAWTRSRRLRGLSRLDASAEIVAANIDLMMEEDGYLDNRDARFVEAFQYPALAASYALGGLWFEGVTSKGGLPDVARLLEGRAWGDFMAAWSH